MIVARPNPHVEYETSRSNFPRTPFSNKKLKTSEITLYLYSQSFDPVLFLDVGVDTMRCLVGVDTMRCRALRTQEHERAREGMM
jgi:hypothetical protein